MIATRIRYRIAALGVAAGVLVVSSWPALSFSPLDWSYEDKLEHAIVYALLSYLATRGWGPGRAGGAARGAGWGIVLMLAVFAGLEEYHQRWIPGRFVEWGDWLADTLGILAGFVVARWQNGRLAQGHSDEANIAAPPPHRQS